MLGKKAKEPAQRTVYLSQRNEEQIAKNRKHGSNRIRTSKYSVLTFLPMNLFLQFNKASNVYFLLIMCM